MAESYGFEGHTVKTGNFGDDNSFVKLLMPNGAAMLINLRTVGPFDDAPPHDCADIQYWAPDGTPMSLGVTTISDGARGPSEARKGHGWDGGDMVILMADPSLSDKQTAAKRDNGTDY